MSESLPLSLDSFCLCRLFDPCAPVPSNACLIGLKWRQSDRSETYLIPTEHSLRLPQTGPSWWPVITDASLCNRSLVSTREALQGHLNIPNIKPPCPPPFTPAVFDSSSPIFTPFHLGASQPPCLVFKWRCLGVSEWCVWEGTCCSHSVWEARVRATVCFSEPHSSSRYGADGGHATIVTHTAPDATKTFDSCICLHA